jgi:hypothetical protein
LRDRRPAQAPRCAARGRTAPYGLWIATSPRIKVRGSSR